MAKKAMIEREKKRQKLVDKFAAKRADLKAIARNQELPMGRAVRRPSKAGKIAAQQLGDPLAQPLSADRSSARVLSQTSYFADYVARIGIQRAVARCGQVKLVRERRNERSYRRYADPYPQRAAARALDSDDPRLEAAGVGSWMCWLTKAISGAMKK